MHSLIKKVFGVVRKYSFNEDNEELFILFEEGLENAKTCARVYFLYVIYRTYARKHRLRFLRLYVGCEVIK